MAGKWKLCAEFAAALKAKAPSWPDAAAQAKDLFARALKDGADGPKRGAYAARSLNAVVGLLTSAQSTPPRSADALSTAMACASAISPYAETPAKWLQCAKLLNALAGVLLQERRPKAALAVVGHALQSAAALGVGRGGGSKGGAGKDEEEIRVAFEETRVLQLRAQSALEDVEAVEAGLAELGPSLSARQAKVLYSAFKAGSSGKGAIHLHRASWAVLVSAGLARTGAAEVLPAVSKIWKACLDAEACSEPGIACWLLGRMQALMGASPEDVAALHQAFAKAVSRCDEAVSSQVAEEWMVVLEACGAEVQSACAVHFAFATEEAPATGPVALDDDEATCAAMAASFGLFMAQLQRNPEAALRRGALLCDLMKEHCRHSPMSQVYSLMFQCCDPDCSGAAMARLEAELAVGLDSDDVALCASPVAAAASGRDKTAFFNLFVFLHKRHKEQAALQLLLLRHACAMSADGVAGLDDAQTAALCRCQRALLGVALQAREWALACEAGEHLLRLGGTESKDLRMYLKASVMADGSTRPLALIPDLAPELEPCQALPLLLEQLAFLVARFAGESTARQAEIVEAFAAALDHVDGDVMESAPASLLQLLLALSDACEEAGRPMLAVQALELHARGCDRDEDAEAVLLAATRRARLLLSLGLAADARLVLDEARAAADGTEVSELTVSHFRLVGTLQAALSGRDSAFDLQVEEDAALLTLKSEVELHRHNLAAASLHAKQALGLVVAEAGVAALLRPLLLAARCHRIAGQAPEAAKCLDKGIQYATQAKAGHQLRSFLLGKADLLLAQRDYDAFDDLADRLTSLAGELAWDADDTTLATRSAGHPSPLARIDQVQLLLLQCARHAAASAWAVAWDYAGRAQQGARALFDGYPMPSSEGAGVAKMLHPLHALALAKQAWVRGRHDGGDAALPGEDTGSQSHHALSADIPRALVGEVHFHVAQAAPSPCGDPGEVPTRAAPAAVAVDEELEERIVAAGKLKVAQLKAQLKRLGLKVAGRKSELLERYTNALREQAGAGVEAATPAPRSTSASGEEAADDSPAAGGVEALLLKAVGAGRSFAFPYRAACLQLAEGVDSMDERARLLQSTHGIAFQHAAEALRSAGPRAVAHVDGAQFAEAVEGLGPLTLVSLTLAANGDLLVTRLAADAPPYVARVPQAGQALLDIAGELAEVLEASNEHVRGSSGKRPVTKKAWWARRGELDARLESLVGGMQDALGCWATLLRPRAQDETGQRAAAQALCDRAAAAGPRGTAADRLCLVLADAILQGSLDAPGLQAFAGLLDAPALATLTEACTPGSTAAPAKPGPLCLVLDGELQGLPFESIEALHGVSCCRMPSLWAVAEAGGSHASPMRQADLAGSTYFVVNPRGDLGDTAKRLAPTLKAQGWEGISGTAKSKVECIDPAVLEEHDVFLYCGHGSSERYLRRSQLREVRCRATVLLMGCSSGRLQPHGDLDPSGMALEYLLAGAPAVVGNLWDVTDGEIDRYCAALLKNWSGDLLDSVQASRSTCRSRYLVGAAPVVFGLPVFNSSDGRETG